MDKNTVDTLLQLNKRFYDTIADEFNQTRQLPWVGWEKLLPLFSALPSPFTVLDLACGNGRFGKFLESHKQDCIYTGVDQSDLLLNAARKQVTEGTFINHDVLNYPAKADVVVVFGLLHHIPSIELRKKFLHSLTAHKLLIVSCWQLTDKRVPWEWIGLTNASVDDGDYLLPWGNREDVYRYCHLTTTEEMSELMEGLPYFLAESFLADGKNGELNRYYIYQSMGEEPLSKR